MIFEENTLASVWKTNIIEGYNQSPRWWLKPGRVKVLDLEFESAPLFQGLEIYSPFSKNPLISASLGSIKQLNVKLVSAWLTALTGTYVFVHRFDTVTGPNMQITCIGKNLFFTGIQDKIVFNLLPTSIDDYVFWGLKVCDKALEGIAVENYRLDFIMVAPSLADLRARGVLSAITKALFILRHRNGPIKEGAVEDLSEI